MQPTAPPWFRFGLVSYFSTLELDPASGAVGWGKLHRDLWEAYRSYLSLSLALLNHWNAGFGEMEPARRGEYEALSWAAVCWMANARPKSLHAFQLAFARGASPQDAWKEALGDRSIPELDAEMRTTMDRGRFAIGEARVPASVAVQNERALTDEEIARLFFQAGNALGARSPPR